MLINGDGLVWVGRPAAEMAGRPLGLHLADAARRHQGRRRPAAAALRELEEETGVRSVELLAEAPGWFTYDLPEELLGVALKGKYRGQKQKWFAMRFTGDDGEIDISPARGHKAEFDDWRWAPAAEVPQLIVPFKRQVYVDVVRTFVAIWASAAARLALDRSAEFAPQIEGHPLRHRQPLIDIIKLLPLLYAVFAYWGGTMDRDFGPFPVDLEPLIRNLLVKDTKLDAAGDPQQAPARQTSPFLRQRLVGSRRIGRWRTLLFSHATAGARGGWFRYAM